MVSIKDELQQMEDEQKNGYQLKTNEQIIDIISEFGNGETEFHTLDVNRLIVDNQRMEVLLKDICKEFKREKPVELYHISHIYNRCMTFLNSLIK